MTWTWPCNCPRCTGYCPSPPYPFFLFVTHRPTHVCGPQVDGDAPPETKGTSEPVELKDLLLGIRGHVMLHSDSNDSALFSEAFREKLSAFSSLTFSLKKTDPKQEGYLFYLSLGLHRILHRARQAEPGLARGLEAALVEFLVSSLERHGSRAKWDSESAFSETCSEGQSSKGHGAPGQPRTC